MIGINAVATRLPQQFRATGHGAFDLHHFPRRISRKRNLAGRLLSHHVGPLGLKLHQRRRCHYRRKGVLERLHIIIDVEAQQLIASIPKDHGDPYPRIVTCLQRSDACKVTEDLACAGWMLAATQERVSERNRPNWRKLRKVLNQIVKLAAFA